MPVIGPPSKTLSHDTSIPDQPTNIAAPGVVFRNWNPHLSKRHLWRSSLSLAGEEMCSGGASVQEVSTSSIEQKLQSPASGKASNLAQAAYNMRLQTGDLSTSSPSSSTMKAEAAASATTPPPPITATKAAASVSKSEAGQAPEASCLMNCLKSPYHTLVTARDLYVSCFTGCAGRTHYGPMMSNPGRMSSAGFGSSRRPHGGDDDVRELIRLQMRDMKAGSFHAGGVTRVADSAVGRTQSAMPTIGRIDEDMPMEFEGNVVVVVDDKDAGGGFRPRSHSFAAVSRSDLRSIRAG